MTYSHLTPIEDVIRENQSRLDKNYAPYNPLQGTQYCDEIERVRLDIPDAPIPVQYIPIEMANVPIVQVLMSAGSLAKAGRCVFGGAANPKKSAKIWKRFVKARCQYDFEFWAVTQIQIVHKELKKMVPFVLNRAQRFYLSTLERLRKAGVPIDIVLLKARQWGGSTLTQFYMLWIQRMWRMHWNSVICGDIDNQAKKVMGMMERALRVYDTTIDDGKKIDFHPYQRTDSTREMNDRGCTISIGSAQHPESLRCEDLCMAHCTEVGLWKRTLMRSPEDLMQSIFGSILSGPYTLRVLESTAKGVGNYFHDEWLRAESGESGFTPVFVPWFYIDMYSKEIEDYKEFLRGMDAEQWELFNLGATLEAIAWFRVESKKFPQRWRFYSEFPSYAQQAFQSTGSCYFEREKVEEMFEDCCDPEFVGEIFGYKDKGNEALQGIQLLPNEHGRFKVWQKADKSTKMENRYLVTVDLGKGMSSKADNSIICVFDRYWQKEINGLPEVVAEWAGHLDMDLIAWKAAQIATYYNNALLVIEDNSLVMSGIDYFMAVLTEIKDYYPNLWKRTVANKTEKSGTARYGWRTDGESKPRICNNLRGAVRQHMYYERCKDAIYEMQVFEEKPDGKLEAVEGKHDDRVITRAIGVTFMFDHNLMPTPIMVSETADQDLMDMQQQATNLYSI